MLDRVPAEDLIAGATLSDLAINVAGLHSSKSLEENTNRSNALTTTGSSKRGLSKRFGTLSGRMMPSWRPNFSGDGIDSMFKSKRGKSHNDPKQVYEGLSGMSLHCALNQPTQLKSALKSGRYADLNVKDDDDDRTALHWAAARGHLRCIQLLIEAGADISTLDSFGQTAGALAEAANQPLAHDLIVHGPPKSDTRSVAPEGKVTVFGLSLHSALNQPTQLKKMLDSGIEWRLGSTGFPKECPLDLNAKDADGDRTALHWAAARGSIECVDMLLKNGASAAITNKEGMTAAALALEFNQRAAYGLIMEWINQTEYRMKAGKMLGSNSKANEEKRGIDASTHSHYSDTSEGTMSSLHSRDSLTRIDEILAC